VPCGETNQENVAVIENNEIRLDPHNKTEGEAQPLVQQDNEAPIEGQDMINCKNFMNSLITRDKELQNFMFTQQDDEMFE